MAKSKYYVVWQGHQPGIYHSWPDCQAQIKNYPGAKYKSYTKLEEAEAAFLGNGFATTKVAANTPKKINKKDPAIIQSSISVDAACSGNPGIMEYQGVWTSTGAQIFHQKFELGTNNIGEFLAIVHCLAMLKKKGDPSMPIYTDSKIAMGWVKKKKCKTTLDRNSKTERLYELIGRAESWLKSNTFSNRILKWETKKWGEIPADFGRK